MSEFLGELTGKMKKTVEVLRSDFAGVRAGRASASVLDRVAVDYYGTQTPIHQVAAIHSPDPRTLTVQPWDATLLKDIEKAILASDLGINPQNDGKVIRLSFPQLTEERRKELIRQVRKYSENAKVSVRNIRRDVIDRYKELKKKSEISEDELKGYEDGVQKETDRFCKEIDVLTEKKESELLTV